GKVYLATFSNQLLIYGLEPDFSISANPGSAAVLAGQSATYSITLQALNAFSGAVTLACSGLLVGATCSFSPSQLSGAGTSTLTINTLSTTPGGSSTITVKGSSGPLNHTASVRLDVAD